MPLEPGSLILTDYTAKVKDTGELVETTYEDEAKKLGVQDPMKRYEPRLIAVGEGWVLKGVDEALQTASVGDKLTLDVQPDKGFGPRDPAKVKLIPLRKFGERAYELRVGDEVEVENKIGIIRFVGSGRAQVDFNHRFAGKTLSYDLHIVRRLQTDEEKLLGLIRRRLPVEQEKVVLALQDGTALIQLPSDSYLAEGLQIIKRAIANDVFKYVTVARKVQFVETYEAPKPKEPEVKPVEVKKEEAPPAPPPVPKEVKPEEAVKAPEVPVKRRRRARKAED